MKKKILFIFMCLFMLTSFKNTYAHSGGSFNRSYTFTGGQVYRVTVWFTTSDSVAQCPIIYLGNYALEDLEYNYQTVSGSRRYNVIGTFKPTSSVTLVPTVTVGLTNYTAYYDSVSIINIDSTEYSILSNINSKINNISSQLTGVYNIHDLIEAINRRVKTLTNDGTVNLSTWTTYFSNINTQINNIYNTLGSGTYKIYDLLESINRRFKTLTNDGTFSLTMIIDRIDTTYDMLYLFLGQNKIQDIIFAIQSNHLDLTNITNSINSLTISIDNLKNALTGNLTFNISADDLNFDTSEIERLLTNLNNSVGVDYQYFHSVLYNISELLKVNQDSYTWIQYIYTLTRTIRDNSNTMLSNLDGYIDDILFELRNLSINNVYNDDGTNIWDFLTSIVEALRDLVQSLLDLTGNLLDGLLDLFKSLLIPGDDYFDGKIDDMIDRLGESSNIINDSWQIGSMIYNGLTGENTSAEVLDLNSLKGDSSEITTQEYYGVQELSDGSCVISSPGITIFDTNILAFEYDLASNDAVMMVKNYVDIAIKFYVVYWFVINAYGHLLEIFNPHYRKYEEFQGA